MPQAAKKVYKLADTNLPGVTAIDERPNDDCEQPWRSTGCKNRRNEKWPLRHLSGEQRQTHRHESIAKGGDRRRGPESCEFGAEVSHGEARYLSSR